MEESQKRRERLKAMRIEAADAAVHTETDGSGLASGGLSNPFVEVESASTTQYFSPRFDYYTDPMAAFSGSRRESITPQVSHGRYNMLPRPASQSMTPEPPYRIPGNPLDQFQVRGSQFNNSPLGRPMGFPTPPGRTHGDHSTAWGPTYQSTTAGPPYQPPSVNPPDQVIYQVPRAHFNQSPHGRPMRFATPSDRPPGNSPNAWGGPGGTSNYTIPSNMSRGSNFGNSSFGQEDYSNHGRGRGQMYHSSSHYESGRGGGRYAESGRGRGRSHNNSINPGSRMGGRRGGSHESVSAEVRPDLYYKKEMVEDPWKMLNPVILKDTRTKDTDKSWLPNSIITKKTKLSTEVPQTSISQESLAQYLASSFGDSENEPVHNEPSS